mmetsp:Transcript_67341/g.152372  ORF Transcript_67341/g.152372 Transcript_67341/m.152372 type:complete len:288 (-) Transcript_67341:4485-5348(-)
MRREMATRKLVRKSHNVLAPVVVFDVRHIDVVHGESQVLFECLLDPLGRRVHLNRPGQRRPLRAFVHRIVTPDGPSGRVRVVEELADLWVAVVPVPAEGLHSEAEASVEPWGVLDRPWLGQVRPAARQPGGVRPEIHHVPRGGLEGHRPLEGVLAAAPLVRRARHLHVPQQREGQLQGHRHVLGGGVRLDRQRRARAVIPAVGEDEGATHRLVWVRRRDEALDLRLPRPRQPHDLNLVRIAGRIRRGSNVLNLGHVLVLPWRAHRDQVAGHVHGRAEKVVGLLVVRG